MPEVNSTSPVTDFDVEQESQRLLRVAAQRNGITVADIPADVVQQARDEARKLLERSAGDENNPYKRMYEEQLKRAEVAESTLTSVREQGQKHSTPAGGPPVSAEQAKARAGNLAWLHQMTDVQKVAALGVDPSTVSLKEAKQVFGKGADPKLGSDLMKVDPARYKTLKQVALAEGEARSKELIGKGESSRIAQVGLAEAAVTLQKVGAYRDPRLYALNVFADQFSKSVQPLVPSRLFISNAGGKSGEAAVPAR